MPFPEVDTFLDDDYDYTLTFWEASKQEYEWSDGGMTRI